VWRGAKALAACSALLLSVHSASTRAQPICAVHGAFDGDPANFGRESARGIVVRVRAAFEPTQETRDSRPTEGIAFVVGFVKKNQVEVTTGGKVNVLPAPCSDREVYLLTARHSIYESDPPRWASKIQVFVPGDDTGVEAQVYEWRSASAYKLGSAQQPPPAEYDAVILRATVPSDFVWPGFRSALELKLGDTLRIPQFGQSGEVTFRDLKFDGIQVHPNVGLVLSSASGVDASRIFNHGDSGKPIFDANWNIVGMFTTENGVATPSDSLRLLLSGHGLITNLTTVAQVRRSRQMQDEARREAEIQQRRSARRRRLEENDGFTRVGLVRLSDNLTLPSGPPMYGGRFGVSGGLPFTSYGPLGFEFFMGYQFTAGYQDAYNGLAEVGGELGIAGYASRHRNVLVSLAWSPSVLLFQGERGAFAFPLAAYSGNLQLGYLPLFGQRLYAGTEVRGVYPFGNRRDFVESFGYVAIGHGD
jgi:hypothetical protein